MKKRFFSAALAGCMMLTMIPVSAFAAGEGATEVAIEQYAAGDATLTKVGASDYALLVKAGETEKRVGDFMDNAGKLKPMSGYKRVNDADPASDCGEASQQNGYFLPLKLVVPGANAKTRVTVEESVLSVSGNAGSTLKEKEYDDSIFVDKTSDGVAHKDIACLFVQVARLDGEYLRDAVKVTVDLNGDGSNILKPEPISMSDVPLVDSAFKNLKEGMEVCTDGSKKFGVSGNGTLVQKRAIDLYDAEKQIVKKVTGFTGYEETDEWGDPIPNRSRGYYLPFSFKLDSDLAVIIAKGVKPNGETDTLTVVPANPTEKEVSFVQRIADTDGKKFYDKIIVDVYPEGVTPDYGYGDGALTKRLTFDVSGVVLDRDVVSKTVRVPKANEVTEEAGGYYLNYRNNIAAVKSIALNAKGDLLTVTADLNALSSSSSPSDYIPVLFSLTKDGTAITAKQSVVKNFGGVIGKDYMVDIDLRDVRTDGTYPTVSVEDNSGNSYEVKYRIVSASKVPVLTDSTVESANGKLTGLTATATAKTAADIKAMYTLNGGTVTILNAAGKILKDTDAVGTGCVIVVKDAEDDEIERVTVVVKGDVLGEGRMHLGQLVAAAKAMNGTEPLEGEYLEAARFNNSDEIDLGDLVGMARLMR